MAPSNAYLRLKRYREKRSLVLEEMYLAKCWPSEYKSWNAHMWAARKRWCIYYHRRRQEREAGFALGRNQPRHWVSRAEGERKRARRNPGTSNQVNWGFLGAILNSH